MIVADKFPIELRKQKLKENLNPYVVLYLFCQFTHPLPKDKFLLLVSLKPEPLFFVVNSEMNDYVKNRPHLAKCHILLEKEKHHFLSHDSYINCNEAKSFSIEEVETQVLENMGRIKGIVSKEIRLFIIEATKASKTLSREKKSIILESLQLLYNYEQ